MRRLLVAFMLVGLAAASSGCVALLAGGAAGAAGYAYATAPDHRFYTQPVDVTTEAVHRCLADLGLPAMVDRSDQLGARIRTRTATGKKLRIAVEPVGMGSEVSVRAGTFGDEALHHHVFARLDQYLTPTDELSLSRRPAAAQPAVQPASATHPEPHASDSPFRPASPRAVPTR